MKQYNFLNRLVGWIVFAIAAVTYILTTEGSVSFWDCGEFTATADKLLVGHPPGAPFFMIVGRLFAILAPSEFLVAKFINIMSALCSAFTILFLFWTITHLGRKIFIDEHKGEGESIELWRTIAVLSAGAVGALAYTFSDTFWFSAVEGEVYAMSSLFTAIVFWAILKWEDVCDEPYANRWLVLIAYMMGLSIGVHLLNLLCIPAIVFVYYFKKFTVNTKNTIKALLVSGALIVAILYGIIPWVVKLASYVELAFVNGFGLPYNSGALFYMVLLLAAIIWGMWYTFKHKMVIRNTVITCCAVILLGYSSFAMIVIRSVANPTMDQNSPEDVFALMDYLNREQYGDRPLFYGQHFNSPLDREALQDDPGTPLYKQRNGKYEVVDYRPHYKYTDNMLFPRMYSTNENHVEAYKSWTNFKGRQVMGQTDEGRKSITRPTFGENLTFFFKYQLGFMYWRYFMWNFSGRQNDIQSHGELHHGNWITGIPVIDNAMLGDQDLLPDTLKNNKGHNRYFMLPFLLGIIGLVFQYSRGRTGKQDFWVVMFLFILTGVAIVVYLNQTPYQPRERDYAYAGSFYAFAIWIGLGVLQIVEWLNKIKMPRIASSIVAGVVCLLCVPTLMAQQNWDDHDRSGCTIARDLAYNYLNSCEENSIIFTNGDNDTFPLWYAQEVEGARPDIRICNLSYLQTDWYCDQMLRKAYDGDPVPSRFTHEQYSGDRDIIHLIDRIKKPIDLNTALDFVASDDPKTKYIQDYPERLCYIPGKRFTFPVDKQKVMDKKVVSEKYFNQIDSTIEISIGKNYLIKNEMMVLDMLATGNWDRPLYYAVTVGSENYVGLDPYFQLEGLAYRIAPIRGNSGNGRVDTEKMYDNVMNKFRWGFYNKPGLYLDENKLRMASNLRNNLSRLATELLRESNASNVDSIKTDRRTKAIAVLDKIQEELPDNVIPHNYFSLTLARGYFTASEYAKGDEILLEFGEENRQELNFFLSLPPAKLSIAMNDIQRGMAIYNEILRVADQYEREDVIDALAAEYEPLVQKAELLFSYR